MITELRAKSQITLPKSIVSSLGISEGDKLEIFEKDGMICMALVMIIKSICIVGMTCILLIK